MMPKHNAESVSTLPNIAWSQRKKIRVNSALAILLRIVGLCDDLHRAQGHSLERELIWGYIKMLKG